MNKEKLRLLKEVFQLEDGTCVKVNKDGLVYAISKMDINALELILEDNVSYHETTKTVFLQKLGEVFQDFKKQDNHLIPYEGKCNSNECPNKNKSGVAFVGNNSGNYINLIIEINENDRINDIYDCYGFCTDINIINEDRKQLSIRVFNDEKTDFTPSATYTVLNNKSVRAINELKRFNNIEISKEEIISWVGDYENSFKAMSGFNLFYKNQSIFHYCYSHVSKVCDFLLLNDTASVALQEFKLVDLTDEIQLLRWLVKYENLHDDFIFLHPDIVPEEALKSRRVNLYDDFNIYFKTDLLQNCIDVEVCFDRYYYEKLNKYKTYSKEEEENKTPFDDDSNDFTSLKHQLEQRGISI